MELKSAWLLERCCLNIHSSIAIIHLSTLPSHTETSWRSRCLHACGQRQFTHKLENADHVCGFSPCWLCSDFGKRWVGVWFVPWGWKAGVQRKKKNLKTVTYPVPVLSCYPPLLDAACLGFSASSEVSDKSCKRVNLGHSLKWGGVYCSGSLPEDPRASFNRPQT